MICDFELLRGMTHEFRGQWDMRIEGRLGGVGGFLSSVTSLAVGLQSSEFSSVALLGSTILTRNMLTF